MEGEIQQICLVRQSCSIQTPHPFQQVFLEMIKMPCGHIVLSANLSAHTQEVALSITCAQCSVFTLSVRMAAHKGAAEK